MPRPTPMGIRHEVFALAREGIKQGAIAARVGLTRATVNRILKRHAATGSLVPGKSSGAPLKTTPRQDRALLRMVRQDRFLSAWALTARMRNLYGMRAGRTTVNNRLLSRGYRAYRPTKKPLLTANHRRLRLEWAQRWRNLTVAHWQHVIFGDESRFQLYPVDGRLRVRRLPGERSRPGCQAHRVQHLYNIDISLFCVLRVSCGTGFSWGTGCPWANIIHVDIIDRVSLTTMKIQYLIPDSA